MTNFEMRMLLGFHLGTIFIVLHNKVEHHFTGSSNTVLRYVQLCTIRDNNLVLKLKRMVFYYI